MTNQIPPDHIHACPKCGGYTSPEAVHKCEEGCTCSEHANLGGSWPDAACPLHGTLKQKEERRLRSLMDAGWVVDPDEDITESSVLEKCPLPGGIPDEEIGQCEFCIGTAYCQGLTDDKLFPGAPERKEGRCECGHAKCVHRQVGGDNTDACRISICGCKVYRPAPARQFCAVCEIEHDGIEFVENDEDGNPKYRCLQTGGSWYVIPPAAPARPNIIVADNCPLDTIGIATFENGKVTSAAMVTGIAPARQGEVHLPYVAYGPGYSGAFGTREEAENVVSRNITGAVYKIISRQREETQEEYVAKLRARVEELRGQRALEVVRMAEKALERMKAAWLDCHALRNWDKGFEHYADVEEVKASFENMNVASAACREVLGEEKK